MQYTELFRFEYIHECISYIYIHAITGRRLLFCLFIFGRGKKKKLITRGLNQKEARRASKCMAHMSVMREEEKREAKKRFVTSKTRPTKPIASTKRKEKK